MNDPMEVCVYGLRDPRDGRLRYVGVTRRGLETRLLWHLHDTGRCHRTNWIRLLLRLGMTPIIFLIAKTNEDDWQEAERFWIEHFRAAGADLVNGNAGGRGNLDPSPEVRAKISASRKGKKASPETCARISAGLRGNTHTKGMKFDKPRIITKPVSAETRAKVSVRMMGNTYTKGKRSSPETRAKISASLKGRPSPTKGLKHTAEAKAKISASLFAAYSGKPGPNKGKTFSAEYRAKLSAAQTERWRKVKATKEQANAI